MIFCLIFIEIEKAKISKYFILIQKLILMIWKHGRLPRLT
jgi:hypothetical protein